MMQRSFAALLFAAAVCAGAQATDVYVWKLKTGGKIMDASSVRPPTYDLSMVPFEPDRPLSPHVPGEPRWSGFQFGLQPLASPELTTWFNECAKGKNIRKNITCTLFCANKEVYSFEALETQLHGLELPGYEAQRPTNFALLFQGSSQRTGAHYNPAFVPMGSNGTMVGLVDGQISMGDGSVRPISMGPVSIDLGGQMGDGSVRPVSVKPIRVELKRTEAAAYRRWFEETALAVETGAVGDGSRLARPVSFYYKTRASKTRLAFSRCFIRACEKMGDGSVRVLLQPVRGEITLESGR